MANIGTSSQTAYSNLDWDHYNQHRPPYPSSLKEIIYKYRKQQPKTEWKRLVDIGGGGGVSLRPFIQDFDTVHLLDPSPLNHKKARVVLDESVSSLKLRTKVEYTVAKAEDGHKHVKDASMTTCAIAAHFIDPDDLIKSMAGILSPGGTLAIYTYWCPVFPDNSQKLSDAYARVMTTALGFCIKAGDEESRIGMKHMFARACSGNSVLDSIPVPEELFDDIQRIRINPLAESSIKCYRKYTPVPFEPLASRIESHEKKIIYESGEDPEAEGWLLQVDKVWLHGVIDTVLPSGMQLTDQQHEMLWGDFDRTLAAECPPGSLRALFPVNIILATRKSGWKGSPQ